MDWKYWTWPRLRVPELRGVMNDLRRFGWPLEKATRWHAQLASMTLDVHCLLYTSPSPRD
eukprot:12092681-Alexandrium_andersonii.AAC.1